MHVHDVCVLAPGEFQAFLLSVTGLALQSCIGPQGPAPQLFLSSSVFDGFVGASEETSSGTISQRRLSLSLSDEQPLIKKRPAATLALFKRPAADDSKAFGGSLAIVPLSKGKKADEDGEECSAEEGEVEDDELGDCRPISRTQR